MLAHLADLLGRERQVALRRTHFIDRVGDDAMLREEGVGRHHSLEAGLLLLNIGLGQRCPLDAPSVATAVDDAPLDEAADDVENPRPKFGPPPRFAPLEPRLRVFARCPLASLVAEENVHWNVHGDAHVVRRRPPRFLNPPHLRLKHRRFHRLRQHEVIVVVIQVIDLLAEAVGDLLFDAAAWTATVARHLLGDAPDALLEACLGCDVEVRQGACILHQTFACRPTRLLDVDA